MNIEGQNKELFLEFVDFVKSKPKDEIIDNLNGWEGDAVGAFCRKKGRMQFEGRCIDFSIVKELIGTGELRGVMGNSRVAPDTYGKLSELLEQYI